MNMHDMIQMDGSQGEGGGQILRSSLSLAMIHQRPLRLFNIRSGRRKPGLMRQHLACVKAAQRICNAQVDGAELKSTDVVFKPGRICHGHYSFVIGTAGSTVLLAQTVLPALMSTPGQSTLRFEGGTHNMMAPSWHFLTEGMLPILSAMGLVSQASMSRAGFFPVGGGQWQLELDACGNYRPFDLTQFESPDVLSAMAIRQNLPAHIVERELETMAAMLDLRPAQRHHRQLEGPGTGNMASVRCERGGVVNYFDTPGRVGTPAEQIARQSVEACMSFLDSTAVVNEHLADQLLLPMMLAGGGQFTTNQISEHTRTNMAVIERFAEGSFQTDLLEEGCWQVRYRSGTLISG